MSDTTNGSAAPESGDDTIEKLDHLLGEWRARIDDLKVQLDLGAMEAKEKLTATLQVAENAYLAARSSLLRAHNPGSDLAAVREDVMRVLRDVKAAYDAVDEVVRRSHSE